jgi:putative ABC transport system ATP-binding protein
MEKVTLPGTLGSTENRMEISQESRAMFLVRLAREFQVDIEKVRAREIMAAASGGGNPGPIEDPEWLRAAIDQMELRAKIAKMTIQTALQVNRDGAILIAIPRGGNQVPLLILPGKGSQIAIAKGELSEREWLKPDQLAARLDMTNMDESRTWMVVEKPELIMDHENPDGGQFAAGHLHGNQQSYGHGHVKPWRRFIGILKPEWDDIWVLIVFAFFAGTLNLAAPIAVESLVNTVAFGKFIQPVLILSLMLFAFLSFSAAMFGLQTFMAELVQRRIFARVVSDLSYRIPRVSLPGVDSIFGPELANRFLDVATLQKMVAGLLLDGISLTLSMIIGMVVLAFYHPWLLGLDVLLLVAVVTGIVILGRGAVKSAMEESKYKYQISSWLEDTIRCHRTFKVDGGADFVADRASHLTSGYLSKRRAHFRILIRQVLFVLTIQAIAGTVLLAFGGLLVIRNQMTLGQLVAAELIVAIILGSLAKFGKHIESFYDALAAADKLGYLFDLPLEVHDGLLRFNPPGPVGVRLSDVNVTVAGNDIFPKNISATWKAADRVAIIGSRGMGKSVLLEILYGLRRPSSGRLEVGNSDPRDLRLSTYRAHVCLAREHEFFTGSLEENIHVHRPSVSKHDIRQALSELGVVNELMTLPDGLDTMIRPDGSPLSQNQARLVLIARAMVGRPKLLLLDSVLDGLDDKDIDTTFETMMSFIGPCTLVIATGRRAIAERCGTILCLDNLFAKNSQEMLLTSDE